MSVCAEKNRFSLGVAASIWALSTASPASESAAVTPTSAENPELDAAGLVMPKVNLWARAAEAMSFQVTGLPSHPSSRALDAFSPSSTGETMTLVWVESRAFAPSISDR